MIRHSKPATPQATARQAAAGVACVIALILLATPIFAQDPAPSQSERAKRLHGTQDQTQTPSQASPTINSGVLYSPDDYRIGAGDVLQISVQDAAELSGMFRVNSSGSILMPFLGRIVVVGASPEDLQKQIADGLRGQYLVNPQVSVIVAQYTSRTFFVQGAVRSPGVYQIEGRPSILKLITLAGGLADNHGSTAFIIHELKSYGTKPSASSTAPGPDPGTPTRARSVADTNPGKPVVNSKPAAATPAPSPATGEIDDAKYELRKVNINGLLRGNFSQNVVIEPGDIINIPPTDVFFVAGEVRSPGSFPLKDGTTLRQAISLAQGTTFHAKASSSIIFREDPATGRRQEIKVDIPQVMSGKKPDIPMLANDIVIVPNSRFKTIGGTLLTAFGSSATRVPAY